MAGLELFISCTFPDGSTTYFQSKLPKKLAANDFEQLVSTVLGSDELNSGADLKITAELIHDFFARFHEYLDIYEAEALQNLQ